MFGIRFLKINNDATPLFDLAYLRNRKGYCTDSGSILILRACPFTLAHKLEIVVLNNKGPFRTAHHIY